MIKIPRVLLYALVIFLAYKETGAYTTLALIVIVLHCEAYMYRLDACIVLLEKVKNKK